VAAFIFFRRLHRISDSEALILTCCCALHPLVLLYSGSVLSEIPFAALALTAMLLAETMLKDDVSGWSAFACGVVLGLSLLTRAFAVPIGAGILLAALTRRSWRQLAIFCAAVFPFFAYLCWKTVFTALPISPASGLAATALGWTHTWTYYTSYINVWKQGVPTLRIFLAIVANNARLLLSAPAFYFIKFPGVGTTVQGMIVLAVSGAAIAGLIREARDVGIRPVHFALPLYAVLVLLWSYPVAARFLLPFLPIFAAGIWIEGKHLAGVVRTTLLANRPAAEKALAFALGFLIVLFAAGVGSTYLSDWRTARLFSERRGTLLEEKRRAYNWICHSTDPGTRVVAYEDASIYLYTGRPASRPFTFTTAEFYDSPRLHNDISHMIDVPLALRAQYWVSSEDDYDFEWAEARRLGLEERQKLEAVLSMVYRSPEGKVRIYSLACLQRPSNIGCEPAKSFLHQYDFDGLEEKGGGQIETR